MSFQNVSNVIATFYDAAYGAATWGDALRDLAGIFDASRAWLFLTSEEKRVLGHTSVDDPSFHSAEAVTAMLGDPLFFLTNSVCSETIVRHSELEDMAGFYRRPLFQDWLQARDVWFGLQGHLKIEAGRRIFVDISHGRNQGDFSDEHKRLLAVIGPHIRRAAEISKALGDARQRSTDGFSVPSVAVDMTGRVLEFNAAASILFDEFGNRSCMRGCLLDCSTAPLAPKVRDLVADAVSPAGTRGGGVVVAGGPEETDGDRFVISVAPLPSRDYFGLSCDRGALIQLRPARGAVGSVLDDELIRLFRLTPSQARLARLISGGLPLRQAAAERGLSYSSARTYLDRIYAATGTRQQSELVALLKAIEASI